MKILFLSNFYPPARSGGYTQWCQEVADGLKTRGHQIGVLTSNYEVEKADNSEQNVYRLLYLEADLHNYQPKHFFSDWRKEQRENLTSVTRIITEFSPDIVFVWGMWAMSKAIPAEVEKVMGNRVVYFLSDYWPSAQDVHTVYWSQPATRLHRRFFKKVVGSIVLGLLAPGGECQLKLEHVICVSAAVRDILTKAGLPLQNARIIHGGTDIDRFKDLLKSDVRISESPDPLKLLYAGQLVEHKGVHTAVEAMALLVNNKGTKRARLTIVGSGPDFYEQDLKTIIRQEKLGHYLTFSGQASKSEMPTILSKHDVLVFPSIYEEPFARMTQEAMLAGLTVVGTTTGGTKEILREGKNGLTFAAENPKGLAEQISRLVSDRKLCHRLAVEGRRTVLGNFTLDKMITDIETYLLEINGHDSLFDKDIA